MGRVLIFGTQTGHYLMKNMADKAQIQKMFQTISPTYDFLNALLSFNIDKCLRKKTIALFRSQWKQKKKQISEYNG